jgi:hypothetical protein
MRRFRWVLLSGFLACFAGGCGEDQPNAPAKPEEVNADFAKKSADMMKSANVGMDPKALKSAGKPAATPGK